MGATVKRAQNSSRPGRRKVVAPRKGDKRRTSLGGVSFPATSYRLRTKSGRFILASPAVSATTRAMWAKAFKKPAVPKTKRRIRRRAWTKEDQRELKAHSKAKTPVNAISKEMKRSVGALRQQALKLGISLV